MLTTEQLLNTMAERGLRITRQRRTLAELFVNTDGYLFPKEIYHHMEERYPGLSYDTVYRNLKLMKELALIEQFNFEDGLTFRLHCQTDDHHHHFICMSCEQIVPLLFCPLDAVEPSIPQQLQVVSHKFEVHGYCKDCQTS